jgi:hypothetical protein
MFMTCKVFFIDQSNSQPSNVVAWTSQVKPSHAMPSPGISAQESSRLRVSSQPYHTHKHASKQY